MCSESLPVITSPRISFSRDLDGDNDEVVVVEMEEDQEDSSSVDVSNIFDHGQQFDFSFSDSFTFEPSSISADELFSDGLIRPLQLEEKFVTSSKHTSTLPPLSQHTTTNNDRCSNLLSSKETNVAMLSTTSSVSSNVVESPELKNQSNNKSFWNIKRSSSVHIDNSYKKSSFWSLPLMLRSNSTGSAPSPRQVSKENKKQNLHKQLKSSAVPSSSFYMYQLSQKPPLKKNHGGSYGNGVWINPVLNVPPPYIAKGTANLFGITSLFKEKKDKKTKK